MEPNAIPGFTHRKLARFVARALVSFEESAKWFPEGRAEVTGMPVREEFFSVPEKPPGKPLTVLITGGSQGSRTLNRAAEESWPLWPKGEVRLIHQTGRSLVRGIGSALSSFWNGRRGAALRRGHAEGVRASRPGGLPRPAWGP